MNRRRFIELLGTAALGSRIIHSFPSTIIPKNIENLKKSDFNKVVIAEIYPKLVHDVYFLETPDLAYWRNKLSV